MLEAVSQCVPALDAANIEHEMVSRQGPYISHNRAEMLRQVMDTTADAAIFLDHDVSWRPDDMVKLVRAKGEVVAGTYRFKKAEVEYMGHWHCHPDGRPVLRPTDGALRADRVPAGFLKVTRNAVRQFMRSYPELTYGDPERPSVDLFNHGAHKGVWWGEDYAFSRRWRESGGEIWLLPDLDITHHDFASDEHPEGRIFPGNLHQWLMRLPGGSEDQAVAA